MINWLKVQDDSAITLLSFKGNPTSIPEFNNNDILGLLASALVRCAWIQLDGYQYNEMDHTMMSLLSGLLYVSC